MRKLRLKTLLALCAFLPHSIFAEISIVLPEIDQLINFSGDAYYQIILKEAAKNAGLKYTTVVMPKKRAMHNFIDKKEHDCLFTFTQTLREKFGMKNIIASHPFGAYKGYIFTLKNSKRLSPSSKLTGLKIGGVLGFEGTYTSLQGKGATITPYAHEDIIFKMLEAKRLDAVLAFLPDSVVRTSSLNWNPEAPFFKSYDRLNCRNTPSGREFLTKLSNELKKMQNSGRTKALLGSFYLPISGEFSLEN